MYLCSRSFAQNCLYHAGCFVQRHSILVITFVFSIFAICCFGLQYVFIETDIVKLWVSEGGRLDEELNYFSRIQNEFGNISRRPDDGRHFFLEDDDPKLRQIPEDEAASSGYQVLIQTIEPDSQDHNLLTKEGLLRHVNLMQEIVHLEVEKFGMNWTLPDICFKPGALDITNDSIAFAMKPTLERLVPCIWISPIDCFFEGSKPLGPSPPIDTRKIPMGELLRLAIPDLPENATWSSINPEAIVRELYSNFDLGTMMNFFHRTGVEHGYLDRPCLNPLDPECPEMSPNYYHACDALEFFKKDLDIKGKNLSVVLSPYMDPSDLKSEAKETSVFDIFGAFLASGTKSTSKEEKQDGKSSDCKTYRKAFLRWFDTNMATAETLLPQKMMPIYPEYGKVMEHGCRGFAKKVMDWPTDMILGGVRDNGKTIEAEALQSVILVASPTDVYRRFKESVDLVQKFTLDEVSIREFDLQLGDFIKQSPNQNATSVWSPLIAKEVIIAWQRKFTNFLYNHELNFKEQRIVHPLAATSISDMLGEFCDFKYSIIFAGYFLMLIYAVYSQLRWDGCCLLSVNSATGLAFAGVLTVTFASIAGLGISTWFGIEFNAATTQIVPFLTLGIGVDNMFLLLHNYPQVAARVKDNEVGVLLKETGMSILMTSINNILSFLTGTVLPIPALRSFCTQSSILLTFNLIAILTVFPAMIALDLRRKKKGLRDLCCLCCMKSDESPEEVEPSYGFDLSGAILTPAQELLVITKGHKLQYHGLVSVDKDDEDEECDNVQPYSLRAFLRNYYIPFIKEPAVKFTIILICACLFAGGIFGIRHSTIGLELSDVLPEHTAPAAFLKARDKYFSFYPMFVVLRGKDIDFPRQQHLIRGLREEIGRSRFVIKLQNGEPSERYWLTMFTEWLQGMQNKLDQAQRDGILANFDTNNATKTSDLNIAYSLACSYGQKYDCSRAGKIRLIDASGTINTEGFYNYMYGWHEYESMFYTVSQASFYPKLHKLRQGPRGRKYRYFIPPAPKPMYSRIPFYLTGLKDTPVIVEMIREIRAICENYTNQGLDNYPNGIAFTFWEQYLSLNTDLMKAIGIISFAVFCVISMLLFNPWAACCIMCILLMMTVELAGFLGLCQIKFNPVSAVSLITAVGIGVEFTAHVVFAFLTAPGTRNERMATSIDRVFVPVIHGALSTLLGILMLGFSEFEFVFKYFFVVMSALIIIGLINGLFLFPVLLSLVGPPCERRDDDGNRLPIPSLPTRRRGHTPKDSDGNIKYFVDA
ncbi:patched family domain-containing protein [Ditylenchus destructor]|nr:patched family domain-containing protein [Ditylenchus destructor]